MVSGYFLRSSIKLVTQINFFRSYSSDLKDCKHGKRCKTMDVVGKFISFFLVNSYLNCNISLMHFRLKSVFFVHGRISFNV